MPRKIRQLRADLRRAGFHLDSKRGKGSHTYWSHPLVPYPVVLSGQAAMEMTPIAIKNATFRRHCAICARHRGGNSREYA